MTHICELFRILSTFLWNFVFYSREAYLTHQYNKMLYHPWPYRITMDENPIPLKRICVLSYLCLLLTKELFETSLKSFQYNTKGLATWIFRDWLSPASKSRHGWKIAKSTLILKTTNNNQQYQRQTSIKSFNQIDVVFILSFNV